MKVKLINKGIKLLLCSSLLISCNSVNEENEKPNIIFILADDLGYSDLSYSGSTYYETPNIDKIAANGVVFTNGYAGSAVCSPSRATIMTGQFTARHGVTDWIGAPEGEAWRTKKRHTKMLPPAYKHHINTNAETLPKAFKEAGYKTFFAGKWHLGDQGFSPENFGFDVNKGGFHRGGPSGGYFDPYQNPKLENRQPGENLSMRLAKETVSFIKASKNKPFFAYLSFYAVHAPIQTSKEKFEKYRTKAVKRGVPNKGFEDGDLLPMRKYQDNPVYAGLIETMDDAVGLVLQVLKENGLDKNTIVVFTSDNGGVTSGDNYSTNNLPLKGGKGYQWEGGIRVPYIISVPWIKNKGIESDIPVAGSDFFPTLLDLAGLPLQPKAHLDGKSILPILKGNAINERTLYWHYPHYGNQGGRPASIMREGDWKLIHFWENGNDELYNLSKDLHESNNLAKLETRRTTKMSKALLNWLKETGAKYPKPDSLYNANKEQTFIKNKKANIFVKYEALRKHMLSKDWQPNKNWWGSIQIED